ncbi:4-(cytidine 5'-diphospho)-2-C-methyl-D-erythritol kinase [Flaviaesturariibacter amylovorans]|uniref:4-diphosphocytidyl-2-C-methyl-D-erythritol kinase n=1 Tax=Flaviaesturariibacter amylovorans TaxID=1084520 RepID=A0ABP8GXV4_9BACT
MIVFPNCKINLGLQVRRRRADGYHDLETIFYPVPLADALELVQVEGHGTIEFSASGRAVEGAPESNICYKAYRLLLQHFPDLPAVRLHLHKVVPTGAGLGGGSADGAFTLTLLNRKLQLGLSEAQLLDYALQLGSDCPFFIRNSPSFAQGRGEALEPLSLDLSAYTLVIVHPGIHIPTAAAFKGVQPNDDRPSLRTLATLAPAGWKGALENDFEPSVFAQYPEIAGIKEALYEAGATYASLTGSGSAVYGLFQDPPFLSFPDRYFLYRSDAAHLSA